MEIFGTIIFFLVLVPLGLLALYVIVLGLWTLIRLAISYPFVGVAIVAILVLVFTL